MKLYVSKNQRRAVFRGKACVFVPYKRTKRGAIRAPGRYTVGSCAANRYCDRCVGYRIRDAQNPSDCLLTQGMRNADTMCGHANRTDETYGYWKEVKT